MIGFQLVAIFALRCCIFRVHHLKRVWFFSKLVKPCYSLIYYYTFESSFLKENFLSISFLQEAILFVEEKTLFILNNVTPFDKKEVWMDHCGSCTIDVIEPSYIFSKSNFKTFSYRKCRVNCGFKNFSVQSTQLLRLYF